MSKLIYLSLLSNTYYVAIWETSNNKGHIRHEWTDSFGDFHSLIEDFPGKSIRNLLGYLLTNPILVLLDDDIQTIKSKMITKCIVTFDHKDKSGNVVQPKSSKVVEFESTDPEEDFKKMIENGSFDSIERVDGTSLWARLNEGTEGNVTLIEEVKDFKPIAKTSLWEAKTIIEEKNPTLGFLLERSLCNGTSLSEEVWMHAYTDGTYDTEYFDSMSEYERDEFTSELEEKVDQTNELIMIIAEKESIYTDYELRIVMKGHPIDDLDVENYFDTFENAIKRGEEMKKEGLIEGFEITEGKKVYNSFGVEQLVEGL